MKAAARLECELAVRTDDVKRLEGCTADLGKLEPNAPATVTYQWSLALQHQDYDRALGLIEVAKKAGFRRPAWRRWRRRRARRFRSGVNRVAW